MKIFFSLFSSSAVSYRHSLTDGEKAQITAWTQNSESKQTDSLRLTLVGKAVNCFSRKPSCSLKIESLPELRKLDRLANIK